MRYGFFRSVVVLFSLILLVTSPVGAVVVNDTTELVDAVAAANAGGDPLIELADGTYTLGYMLIVTRDGVTVRGLSGYREAVIVEGQGMWGSVTH